MIAQDIRKNDSTINDIKIKKAESFRDQLKVMMEKLKVEKEEFEGLLPEANG